MKSNQWWEILTTVTTFIAALACAGGGWVWCAKTATQEKPTSCCVIVEPPSDLCKIRLSRIEAKEAVIELLLNGEVSLAEAAARFQYLNNNPPEAVADIKYAFLGATDEEKVCRQVIAWAKTVSTWRANGRDADIISRLEYELDRLLMDGKPFGLPQ